MKGWMWLALGAGALYLLTRKGGQTAIPANLQGTMSRILAAHKAMCPNETVTGTYLADGLLCFSYTGPKGGGKSCLKQTAGTKTDAELRQTLQLMCG